MGADGRSVIFESFASDLAANDFNETKDIFLLRLGHNDSDNDGLDDDWEMAYFNGEEELELVGHPRRTCVRADRNVRAAIRGATPTPNALPRTNPGRYRWRRAGGLSHRRARPIPGAIPSRTARDDRA